MTKVDPVSALSIATEDRCRRRDENGQVQVSGGLNIKKRNGKGAYGAVVGDHLFRQNGTYRWDMNDPRTGLEIHDNIYQALAADIFAAGEKLGVRRDIGRDYEKVTRSGVQSLATFLDEQMGLPLYRCTSPDNRRNQVVVITVHPDLIVDEDEGTTALEAMRARDIKSLEGQTVATLRRLAKTEGENARALLSDKLSEITQTAELPEPRRSPPLLMDDSEK